jgi:hypothetical protein
MKHRIFLLLALAVLPLLVGCPGNRTIDKQANDALWAWVEQNDAAGWEIVGFPGTTYTNIIVDHEFRPTKLNIAIKGDEVNPYHQRNLLEMIAREWRNKYPANLKPRFPLRVTFYDMEINRDKELGYTDIDQDGNPDTHHGQTQDVM